MTQFLRNKNIGFSKNYSNPKEPLFYKSISNRGNKQNRCLNIWLFSLPFAACWPGIRILGSRCSRRRQIGLGAMTALHRRGYQSIGRVPVFHFVVTNSDLVVRLKQVGVRGHFGTNLLLFFSVCLRMEPRSKNNDPIFFKKMSNNYRTQPHMYSIYCLIY
jgi:hypothetical protein